MSNPQVENYIKESRQFGMSDEQIHRELLNSGWKDSNLEFFFKKPRKLGKFIIGVVAVVLLITGGALAYYKGFLGNALSSQGLVPVDVVASSPHLAELIKRVPFTVFVPTKLPSKNFTVSDVQQSTNNFGKTISIDYSIQFPQAVETIGGKYIVVNIYPSPDDFFDNTLAKAAFEETNDYVTINGRKLSIIVGNNGKVRSLTYKEDNVGVSISNGPAGYQLGKLSKDELVGIAASMQKKTIAADYHSPVVSETPVVFKNTPVSTDQYFVANNISSYVFLTGASSKGSIFEAKGYDLYKTQYVGTEMFSKVPPPEEETIGLHRAINVGIAIRAQNLGASNDPLAMYLIDLRNGEDLIKYAPIVTEFGKKIKLWQVDGGSSKSASFTAGWPINNGFVHISGGVFHEAEKEVIRQYLLKYPSVLK